MKTAVIIPARYSSTRFPGKPLIELLKKPMIIWVAEIASQAVGKENVFIATDDYQIKRLVEKYKFKSVITNKNHLTGTDRVAEAAEKIDADIFVNLQGDEPLVEPKNINKIIHWKIKNLDKVINGFCYLSNSEDPKNINIPKVITNEENKLIYMSRSAIPGSKSKPLTQNNYKKQVCIYAFTLEELKKFRLFGRKSVLEEKEDIEILRFLEINKEILMVKLPSGSLAVDIPDDIPKVEEKLKTKKDKIYHTNI